MKNIALAILAVGLCFYNAYQEKNGNEQDSLAIFFAIMAALGVFIV